MVENDSESGTLKRKLDEEESQKTKDEELSSPPAKVRATDESSSESEPSKANVLDVAPSSSVPNQTSATTESSGETYGEREKMQ